MAKSFQKSANNAQQVHLDHPGIISSQRFNDYFDLRCYVPSPDLRPFIVHIWTQRIRKPLSPPSTPPIEILSGPFVYLFFTPEGIGIHTPDKHQFAYDPFAADVIAGVKFKPGGFYAFGKRSISDLARNPLPLAAMFPSADDIFVKKILAQPDAVIVRVIEELLRSSQPQADKNLGLIADIMQALTSDNSLQTVSATAQTFGMSERSLQLLFHTYVGTGIKWIIRRRRLLQAISRGQGQSPRTWVEVAAELGYSSQSHFSRDFKEATGLAPSEYLRHC